jgi:hypothetical protein
MKTTIEARDPTSIAVRIGLIQLVRTEAVWPAAIGAMGTGKGPRPRPASLCMSLCALIGISLTQLSQDEHAVIELRRANL